jgi:hypothetical protein
MRAVILAFVSAAALAVSAQAATPPPKPSAIGLGVAPPVELVRDGCGRGWHRHHWRDGVTAFLTEVVLTAAMARGHTIRRRFGAAPLRHGVEVGVTHIERHRAEPSVADDPERACPSGNLTKAKIT